VDQASATDAGEKRSQQMDEASRDTAANMHEKTAPIFSL